MVTIVLAAKEGSEDELKALGFKQETVWTHYNLAYGEGQAATKAACDSKVFAMKKVPNMFVTTSWWGAGPE